MTTTSRHHQWSLLVTRLTQRRNLCGQARAAKATYGNKCQTSEWDGDAWSVSRG